MKTTRRGLFGLFAGALALPYVPVEALKVNAYTRYTGYQVLNISPSDIFSATEYDWKQAAAVVTIGGINRDGPHYWKSSNV